MTRLEVQTCVRSSRPSSRRSSAGSRGWRIEDIEEWIRLLIAALFAALGLAYATGCTRTILVREASPIRIGPRTEARVYAVDPASKEWRLSENRVEIPEGWYCVPPSFVEESDG
jgi:hypothetical protein